MLCCAWLLLLLHLLLGHGIVVAQKTCSEISPSDKNALRAGLLYPLTNHGTGYQRAAAAIMAIRQVNGEHPGEDIVAGLSRTLVRPDGIRTQVTYRLNNTQKNPSKGLLAAEWQLLNHRPHFLVGPASSSVCSPTNLLASAYSVPQGSYSCTASQLSNKAVYPFFLRTVPTDATQSLAVAGLIHYLGWRQVLVINSLGSYGAGFRRDFNKAVHEHYPDLKIVREVEFPSTLNAASKLTINERESIRVAIEQLKQTGTTVIVAAGQQNEVHAMMSVADALGMVGPQYTWILTDSAVQADFFSSSLLPKHKLVGVMGVVPSKGEGTGPYTRFERLWRQEQRSSYPELLPFWTSNTAFSKDPINSYVPYSFDAVAAFVIAAAQCRALGQWPPDGDNLLAQMHNITFEGVTGTVYFDDKGDRIGVYEIMNARNTSASPSPSEWTSIGTFAGVKRGVTFDKMQPMFSDGTNARHQENLRCDSGQYSLSVGDRQQCVSCPTGSYCRDGLAAVPCPEGTYTDKIGQEVCSPCDGTEYSEGSGATTCKPCATYTERKVGSPGNSSTECVCQLGYYLPHGHAIGSECLACPENAKCDGGITQPYPDQGFALHPAGDFFVKCTSGDLILHADKVDVQQHSTSELHSMTWINESGHGPLYVERCVGGRNHSCGPRFEGPLCHYCRPGHYPLNGHEYCYPCLESTALNIMYMLPMTLFILVLWILLAVALQSTAAEILLTHLQIINLVQEFNVDYPTMLSTYAVPMVIFNFDTDFVTPSCLWPDLTYHAVWLSSFLIPIVFAIFLLLIYGFSTAIYRVRRCLGHSKRSKSFCGSCELCPITTIDLSRFGDRLLQVALNMLLAMYATLCEKTFYGLGWGGSCVPIADGISVMYKDPKVVCGSAEHYKYLVPSYISLVVYVAGVPAMVTGIVFYLRAKNLMANSRVLNILSSLYEDYEPGMFWWFPLLLIRLLLLVALRVLAWRDSTMQAALGALVVIGFLVLQFSFRPYIENRLDVLECLSSGSICLYIFAAMLFAGDGLSIQATNNLGWITLLQSAFIVLICASGWIYEVVEDVCKKRSVNRLESLAEKPGTLMYIALRNTMGCHLTHNLQKIIGQMFDEIDLDNNGILSRCELTSFLKSQQFLDGKDLAEAIDKIFELYDKGNNGEIDLNEFGKLIHDSKTTGELVDTFKVFKLHTWSQNTEDKFLAAGYFQLDKWMSPIVCDESHMSVYDRNSKADLYRKMVEACPFIIDFLAAAPRRHIEDFRRCMYLLEQMQETVGDKGLFAQHLQNKDNSSVFYWLAMWADEHQQETFRTLLTDIHDTQGGWDPSLWAERFTNVVNMTCSEPCKTSQPYPTERLSSFLQLPNDELDKRIHAEEANLRGMVHDRILRKTSFITNDPKLKAHMKKRFTKRWIASRRLMRAAKLIGKHAVAPEKFINEKKTHMEDVSSVDFETTGSGTLAVEQKNSINESNTHVEDISSLDFEITDPTAHDV